VNLGKYYSKKTGSMKIITASLSLIMLSFGVPGEPLKIIVDDKVSCITDRINVFCDDFKAPIRDFADPQKTPFYKIKIITPQKTIEHVVSNPEDEVEDSTPEITKEEPEKPVHKVSIIKQGTQVEIKTKSATVGELAKEANIQGTVSPPPSTPIHSGIVIRSFPIERVEESREESVELETKKEDDDTLEKGKTKVEQKGEEGTKLVVFEITLENGKEISSKKIREEIIKEPVSKIIKVGTKEPEKEVGVEPEKSEANTVSVKSENDSTKPGVASNSCGVDSNRSWNSPGIWVRGKTDYQHNPFNDIGCYPSKQQGYASHYGYDFKAPDGVASTRYPWGTKLRVTNLSNGKSTIVTVNDWGPFVSGRVVDMSRTSFSKIASPSEGIINVMVEPVQV
jgi:rare lipoprotein A (peptidoglycan hydrolase)